MRRTFRSWCGLLRKHFPSQHSVRIRRVHPSKVPRDADGHQCIGHTIMYEDGSFVVYISNTLDHGTTVETLWEEWAHVLRLHNPHVDGSDRHDEIYGAIFNKIKSRFTDRQLH